MEWKSWQSFPLAERHRLPCSSGIYTVVDCNENVWYVGQAINLNTRWAGKSHHRYAQLSRSSWKHQHRIYWKDFSASELNQMEQYYIALFIPSMNGTKVKQYFLGKPQLKIQIGQDLSGIQYAYFRGNSECYEDIAEFVGIFPCTNDDESHVSIAKEQIVKRGYASAIAIKYRVNGKDKTIKLLCSLRKYGYAFTNLRGAAYRGGIIIRVWQPQKVRYD
jgi:hypothetical protein